MSKNDRHDRLIAYSFAAAIVISCGVFLLDVFDYVGTAVSSRNIDVSIADITITPSGDELQIALFFVITNPTAYSRTQLHFLYNQLFLDVNGKEELIGADTFFAHEALLPYREALYKVTLSVPKTRNQLLSTCGPDCELQWRIRCLIHLETPIRDYYQSVEIRTTSSGPTK